MADVAGFDPNTARWLIRLARQLESSQVLNPGYLERVVLKVMPRFQGGDGSIKYAYPPSGGLPAASYNATTEELTPSSSNCELAELVDGVYQRSGESVAVENPVGASVGTSGKPMTVGQTAYGKWTVLVEDCTGTTEDPGGGGPNPEPPVPDAIDSGTSKGIDMGYSMGV